MRDFITWSLALEGAKLACQNATRLADDALELHKMHRYPTAFSISILAWEETNKAGLLLKAYVEKKDISKDEWRKKFISHQKKIDAFSEYFDIIYPTSPPRSPEQTVAAATRLTDLGRALDLQKQHLGLYTDFGENTRKWHSPADLNQQMIEYANWLGNYYATQSKLTCHQIGDCLQKLGSM